MKICVYTCILNDYDKLIEPFIVSKGIDYICFTNTEIVSKNWKCIKINLDKDLTISKNCRKYKILPHLFLKDYDLSIWIDGNILIKDNLYSFINTYIQNKITVFNHNSTIDKRNCIYEEYKAINKLKKDKSGLASIQIFKYRSENYPENNGLLCSGILIRKHNDKEIIKLMEEWWNEVKNFSHRDQLSFNYVVWKNKLEINYINQDIRKNKYFYIKKHLLKII